MKKKMKLNVRMAAENKAVIELFDDIGAWDFNASRWSDCMATVAGADEVVLRINSYGGELVEALAIVDMIRNSGKVFKCEVYGMCASAATVVALACGEVKMCKSAMWMVHEPYLSMCGTLAELQAVVDALAKHREDVFSMYAAKTGKSAEQIMQEHAAGVYYTADEALAYGWIDGIIGAEDGADEPKAEPKTEPETEPETEPVAEGDEPEVEPEQMSAAGKLLALMGLKNKQVKAAEAVEYWKKRAARAEVMAKGFAEAAEAAGKDAEEACKVAVERVNALVAAKVAELGFGERLPQAAEGLPVRAKVDLAEVRAKGGADAAIDAAVALMR